jgi:hypothetical protein
LAAVSVSMSLLLLGVVAQAGDLNSRVKGIDNCTKAQASAQVPGRVSSKGPPQYYQTSALPTKSVDWFVKLLKDWLSLHPIRFPTFVNRPPCLVRYWWPNSPQGLTHGTSDLWEQ